MLISYIYPFKLLYDKFTESFKSLYIGGKKTKRLSWIMTLGKLSNTSKKKKKIPNTFNRRT